MGNVNNNAGKQEINLETKAEKRVEPYKIRAEKAQLKLSSHWRKLKAVKQVKNRLLDGEREEISLTEFKLKLTETINEFNVKVSELTEIVKNTYLSSCFKVKDEFYYGTLDFKGFYSEEGVLIRKDTVFAGSFKDNCLTGNGVILKRNIYLFKGKTSQNKPHGRGTMITKQGKYFGNWDKGMFSGKFVKETKVNTITENVVLNAVESIEIEDKRGSTFFGETVNGVFEGRITFKSGEVLVGTVKNGEIEGKCTYTWSKDCFYQGDYKKSLKEGKGLYVEGLFSYEGHFFKGQFHGEATVSLNGVSRYICKFRYGKLISGHLPTLAHPKTEENVQFLTETSNSKQNKRKIAQLTEINNFLKANKPFEPENTARSAGQIRKISSGFFKQAKIFKFAHEQSNDVGDIIYEHMKEVVAKGRRLTDFNTIKASK